MVGCTASMGDVMDRLPVKPVPSLCRSSDPGEA